MPRFEPAPNCLSGCVEKYYSKPLFNDVPYGSPPSQNFAPFIKVTINNGSNTITVGNESYPTRPNTAVIKSIEFGFMNALDGNLEIIDEEGGELGVFLDSLQKCGQSFNANTVMEFRVGWVTTDCDGNKGPLNPSPLLKAIILEINSNISNGVIRFQIKFSTIDKTVQQFRHDETFGQEEGGKDMTIEDAIRELCAKAPQINVRYARRNQSGEIQYVDSLKWVNHGDKGPKAAWTGDSQNKYSTIAKWIEPYRIDDGKKGKGVMLIHDPASVNDLIVLEDPTPNEGEKQDARSLGTFIVNGGRCSSVLEFSPTVNIISALGSLSSGGSTKTTGTGPVKAETEKSQNIQGGNKDVGSQTTFTISQPSSYSDGKNAPDEVVKSLAAHLKASKFSGLTNAPITAELRIVGNTDPRFYQFDKGQTVSIVVISPNHINGGKAGQSCGDFLKTTTCHPFFSNKEWTFMGWNHAVQEGSFVTTLKLFLATPGIDIGANENLGANETGTQAKNTC